jgi:microcin C transport system substrate-binding protein
VRYDYYRDSNVIIEALKSGDLDFRAENSSKAWATAYDTPSIKKGTLIKKTFPHKRVVGMQGYVFNQRRNVFKDRAVRKAISYAFDFEWANKVLFYGQYSRSRSYFGNSAFEANTIPSGKTLTLLEPWRKSLPAEVFDSVYQPPNSQGTQAGFRQNLREASDILKEAGWVIKDGARVREEDGLPIVFEIMLFDPLQERIALPFVQNLKKLGITARIRTVDAAQYVQRLEKFDFDMVVTSWGQSDNPGNEQYDMWSSRSAQIPGSSNLSGIALPAIDSIIKEIVTAKNRQSLTHSVRALDTILQWHYLVVPHFQSSDDRVLFWNRFGMPKTIPASGVTFGTWWIDNSLTLNQ